MTKRCRCFINLKYYAGVVSTGAGTLKGYKPCPLHEPQAPDKPEESMEEALADARADIYYHDHVEDRREEVT